MSQRFPTGLIVGRFNPPHLGHGYLIEHAAQRCDHLVVFVDTRDGELVPGELRASWLAALHPAASVVEIRHDLATDFADDSLWTRWLELFRSRWPLVDGPHAVFGSDPYIGELARRLGAVAISVDPTRATVSISATQIRASPADHLHHLAPPVREWVEAHLLG